MKLSIVIPVYGSQGILREGYKAYSKAVGQITDDYEIIYRVDGSPDGSEAVLKELAAEDDHVRVFSHSPNRGLGYTLRTLFKDATGDYVIYFDADSYLCFDLSFLPAMIEKTAEADAVIASRYMFNPLLPFQRWLASEAYYLLNKLLFKIEIRDIGSGFVVMKKSALDGITLTSDGFEIHTEIFVRLARNGHNFLEVPLAYKHWAGGSFRVLTHGPKALIDTLRLWKKL